VGIFFVQEVLTVSPQVDCCLADGYDYDVFAKQVVGWGPCPKFFLCNSAKQIMGSEGSGFPTKKMWITLTKKIKKKFGYTEN